MKYPVTITKLAKSTGYSHHIIRRNIALLTKKGEIHTRMVGGVTFIDVKEAELRKGA